MSVKGQGELGLLERIKPYLPERATGDDAAVIGEIRSGWYVASTDMFVEGVHFDLSWMPAKVVGWRSLALALGDLAAKGADPGWALSSLALPKTWTVDHVSELYEGMADLAGRFDFHIEGGDLSSIDGPAVLSLTVVGRVKRPPVVRSAAQAGWSVAVTGPLGGAAVALRERRAARIIPLIDRGRELNALGLCCGDISDGLVREMEKFLAMSGVGCDLRAADVPRADGASLVEALTSGEEPELVCVGPPKLIKKSGLQVVGEMKAAARVDVIGAELSTTGYDHFA